MKRAILIIPNQDILNAEFYCKDLLEDEFHGLGVEIFSKMYNLGITYDSLGLKKGEYPGYIWQAKLTSLGHAIICAGDCEPLVIYLPDNLSKSQLDWFNDYQFFFQKHKNKISYLVINKNEEVIENSDIYTNNVLEQMYLVINNLNSKKGR